MPYIASNNGWTVIWRDAAENYQPKAGEVVFDTSYGDPLGSNPNWPTVERLKTAFPDYDLQAPK